MAAVAEGAGLRASLASGAGRATATAQLATQHVFSQDVSEAAVRCLPGVVHFGGFTVGETHVARISLLNVGKAPMRTHIIAPPTPFFHLEYKKLDRFVPGLAQEIDVVFTPNAWRYYYDCIRVHTQHGSNLVVPIHAYPVVGQVDVPPRIDFGAVPVGEPVTRRIPLTCTVPIDFEFRVRETAPGRCFTVAPASGTIPAKGSTEITVTFTPEAFSTVSAAFEVSLSQYNSKPMPCSLTGSSTPGLAKAQRLRQVEREARARSAATADVRQLLASAAAPLGGRPGSMGADSMGAMSSFPGSDLGSRSASDDEEEEEEGGDAFDAGRGRRSVLSSRPPSGQPTPPASAASRRKPSAPPSPAPSHGTRKRRQLSAKRRASTRGRPTATTTRAVTADGLQLPAQIQGMASVNYVLNQRSTAGQAASGMKVVLQSTPAHARKRLEEAFLKREREGRQRPPALGSEELTQEHRRRVLADRRHATEVYNLAKGCGEAARAQALSRRRCVLEHSVIRGYRVLGECPPVSRQPVFVDSISEDLKRRHEALQRFIQAARRVIVRQRVARRFESIAGISENDWGQQAAHSATATTSGLDLSRLPAHFDMEPFQFPVHSAPRIVQPRPEPVLDRADVAAVPRPALARTGLEVARVADTLGYRPLTHAHASLALPGLTRMLRRRKPVQNADSNKAPGPAPSPRGQPGEGSSPFAMPDCLRNAPESSAAILSDLLPTPEFHAHVPFAEVSDDHWLKPGGLATAHPPTIPRVPTAEEGSQGDLIPELMLHKRHPAYGVLQATAAPSLSHVWVPRLSLDAEGYLGEYAAAPPNVAVDPGTAGDEDSPVAFRQVTMETILQQYTLPPARAAAADKTLREQEEVEGAGGSDAGGADSKSALPNSNNRTRSGGLGRMNAEEARAELELATGDRQGRDIHGKYLDAVDSVAQAAHDDTLRARLATSEGRV